jgi:hypothetical protein
MEEMEKAKAVNKNKCVICGERDKSVECGVTTHSCPRVTVKGIKT